MARLEISADCRRQCTQGNQQDGCRSYRTGLRKDLVPKFGWQISGCQQVNLNPQQRLQLHLKAAEVKQRGARQSIDQQIQVTAICVGAVQDRAENARVGHMKTRSGFTDNFALAIEGR